MRCDITQRPEICRSGRPSTTSIFRLARGATPARCGASSGEKRALRHVEPSRTKHWLSSPSIASSASNPRSAAKRFTFIDHFVVSDVGVASAALRASSRRAMSSARCLLSTSSVSSSPRTFETPWFACAYACPPCACPPCACSPSPCADDPDASSLMTVDVLAPEPNRGTKSPAARETRRPCDSPAPAAIPPSPRRHRRRPRRVDVDPPRPTNAERSCRSRTRARGIPSRSAPLGAIRRQPRLSSRAARRAPRPRVDRRDFPTRSSDALLVTLP